MESDVNIDGMSCQQLFATLSEYLDAELPADICNKLSGHIQNCAPCVEFVKSLKQSIALCREFKPGEAPKPIADAVREKLRQAYESMSSDA